jgi:homoserine kinase
MYRIKTPASSANVGPGFDCLGLSLDLYNTFDIEESDRDVLENVEERYNNADNLFLQAFHTGCQKIGSDKHIRAAFHCDIPVSRGLGSSASMIVGGLVAASVLNDDGLSDDEIFQTACAMEGHPDNAAPCFYGGLTASGIVNSVYRTHALELHPDWHYTVFIPDFEVSTEKARAILPESCSRKKAAANAGHAIWMIEALRSGSLNLLKAGAVDYLHEPYRKTLIRGYDSLKEITERESGGVLVISGSGSTCLLISRFPLNSSQKNQIQSLQDVRWDIHEVHPAKGTEVWGDSQ